MFIPTIDSSTIAESRPIQFLGSISHAPSNHIAIVISDLEQIDAHDEHLVMNK